MSFSSDSYLGAVLGLGTVLIYLVGVALGALCLMFAWNACMPFIFHLPVLNFIQSFCLGFVFRSLICINQPSLLEKKANA